MEYKSALFLGIGGISMHQLAIALQKIGIKIFGYDNVSNEYTKKCEQEGIVVTNRFNKNFLNCDFCVKTGAIKNSKYLFELKRRGIKIVDRSELLGFLCSKFKTVIAVSGTHGKSTTANLIYEMLRVAGEKVSCHIGADVFLSRFNLGDDYLVVEACEFNKSFLSIYPTISVVTNVEADHLESYGNIFNLKNAFSVFLKRGEKRFVFNEDSTKFLRQIKNVEFVDRLELKDIKLKGEHNLKNVSLAVAVCRSLNIDETYIIEVINQFKGVPRRYEFVGNFKNQKIYIDYAHHPTEIDFFVKTFCSENKSSLIVFQPHTFSRTKLLIKDFVRVLSKIDNLIIFKEYPARERKEQGYSAKQLFEIVKQVNPNVKYCASLKSILKNMQNFKQISFVGAGDINQIAKKIIKSY